MFRSGLDTAKETVAAVGAAKVACANCDAALGDVKKYLAADVSSCSVAVIGVISKSRAVRVVSPLAPPRHQPRPSRRSETTRRTR